MEHHSLHSVECRKHIMIERKALFSPNSAHALFTFWNWEQRKWREEKEEEEDYELARK